MENKYAVVIYGPTGVGKTSTSIDVAKMLNGEIISADSMQIYKGMDIGTAKVTKEEMQGVKHYLIDVCKPNREFTVCDYVKKAKEKIDVILAKGKTPIIVGGTGLYLKALIENYDFNGVYKDEKIRKYYQQLAKKFGNEYVYNILKEKNPTRAEALNVNDTFRIIRALEIFDINERDKNVLPIQNTSVESDVKYIVFALTMDREKLYKRINKRVNLMYKQGLKNEVQTLIESGINPNCPSMQGIGYKEMISYLNKKAKARETKELIKRRSRNYAKRQLTFMHSINNVNEISAGRYAAKNIVKFVKNEMEKENEQNW